MFSLRSLHGQRSVTRRHAKDEIISWLLYYNESRLRSTLGYTSPMKCEGRWHAEQAMAARSQIPPMEYEI